MLLSERIFASADETQVRKPEHKLFIRGYIDIKSSKRSFPKEESRIGKAAKARVTPQRGQQTFSTSTNVGASSSVLLFSASLNRLLPNPLLPSAITFNSNFDYIQFPRCRNSAKSPISFDVA
ncbi:hypothetical protein SADUNF_Sadunf06G0009300 [Salix dunnii]|uniref:Uncharacterized protein n=1 Tax=Salix dunnii TaxID=1413687 RepID=A0A835K4U1_9ROSI|nr:hypothetical protein SADUNF_Sadunf06G0009300 [Salix dunnii]